MSELRSDAIQAIAAALMFEVYDFIEPDNTANTAAEAALDALLDFLEAHTEEWSAAAIQRLKDRGYFRLDSVPDWESELLQSLRVEP